jgi:hypothetical protein
VIKFIARFFATAALAAPLIANATLFDFTATLNALNENPSNSSTGTGFGSLQYNDGGTPGIVTDDSFFVLMGASGLTGTPTGWHIHGAATVTEIASVRIPVDALLGGTAGVGTLVSGGLISYSLANDARFNIPATPASGSNAGHPAMSFLSMLQSGLAYMNVHTATFPGGEIRGQLVQVSAVPEPGSYAMLIAGLVLVGTVARRRKARA